MQPLAITVAPTASTILINTRIIALVFRLTSLAVDLNIVDLHVAITIVVIVKLYGNLTADSGIVGIVLHAGGQGPACNNIVVNEQVNVLAANCSPRADHNGAAPATRA